MRFIPVCCPRCGLSFTVIASGRHRSARFDREAWGRTCPRAVRLAQPALCDDFRVVAMGVPAPDEPPSGTGGTT